MAKASQEEWQQCMDFANNLEEKVRELSDDQLGRWVKENYVWLGRTLYGYRVLVDNACDPAKDTLEWNQEIAEALAAHREAQRLARAAQRLAQAPAPEPEPTTTQPE